LTGVLDLLEKNEVVREFLADHRLHKQGKAKALREILSGQIESPLLYFLSILVEQNMISRVSEIASAFFEQVSLARDTAAGELVAPVALPEDKVTEIQREASRVIGKDVDLRVRVDPNLLAGLRIRVGDCVLDGTIDRQLEQLRQRLLA